MTNTELAKNELNKFVSDLEDKCNDKKIEIITDNDIVIAVSYFYDENNVLCTTRKHIGTLLF